MDAEFNEADGAAIEQQVTFTISDKRMRPNHLQRTQHHNRLTIPPLEARPHIATLEVHSHIEIRNSYPIQQRHLHDTRPLNTDDQALCAAQLDHLRTNKTGLRLSVGR